MVSIRSLFATLLVGQAFAKPLLGLEDPDGALLDVIDVITVTKYVDPATPTTFELNPGQFFKVNPNVNLIQKRSSITSAANSIVTDITGNIPTFVNPPPLISSSLVLRDFDISIPAPPSNIIPSFQLPDIPLPTLALPSTRTTSISSSNVIPTLTVPSVISTTTTSSSSSLPTITVVETTTSYSTTVTVTQAGSTSSTTSSSTASPTSSSSTTSSSSMSSSSMSSSTTSSSTMSSSTMSSSSIYTSTGTTTTSSSSTSSTSACPTTLYKIRASNTGDSSVDSKYAQLVPIIGSIMSMDFISNFQNAQQYRLGGPSCSTLMTSDGSMQAIIGGDMNTNLANVFFYSSPEAAARFINANFEALVCTVNADETLSCTGAGKGIFQTTPDRQNLQIGNQNYGNKATLNLTPVPASVFKN